MAGVQVPRPLPGGARLGHQNQKDSRAAHLQLDKMLARVVYDKVAAGSSWDLAIDQDSSQVPT